MLIEFLKQAFAFFVFLFFAATGLIGIQRGDTRGWFVVVVVGGVALYTLFDGYRKFCTKIGRARVLTEVEAAKRKKALRKPAASRVMKALASCWHGFAAIVFGLASYLLTDGFGMVFMPSLAVWLCSFVFTLTFYPFQKRREGGVDGFPRWAIYSTLMGGLSVLLSLLAPVPPR